MKLDSTDSGELVRSGDKGRSGRAGLQLDWSTLHANEEGAGTATQPPPGAGIMLDEGARLVLTRVVGVDVSCQVYST